MSKYLWLGILLAFSFTLFFTRVSIHQKNRTKAQQKAEQMAVSPSQTSKIQVALILDTSNSMDGLIEQAKSQLWKLVNELTGMEKSGENPTIEIALYQYGNQGLSVSAGYIQQISTLDTDLDQLSKHLFTLTTNGGSEYCGWAIKDALDELPWSNNPNDLKMIFIAGNEPFNQGPIRFSEICKEARHRGIIVNTIHCGDYQTGVREFWKDGADIARGQYMNIDHNDQVVHIATPYDATILELNSRLNETYLHYGTHGAVEHRNQADQDANAHQFSSANARTRAFVKSKKAYKNEKWDLVDYSSKRSLNDFRGRTFAGIHEKDEP